MEKYKIQKILDSAKSLCTVSKFIEAKKILWPLLDLQSKNSDYLTLLGSVEIALKNFKDGINLLEKSLLISRNQIKARINLGNAYLDLGNEKKALENYRLALKIDLSEMQPYFLIGLLLKKQGRLNESLKIFHSALLNGVESEYICYQLGTVYEALDLKVDAYKYFILSTNINKKFFRGYHAQANHLYDTNKFDSALNILSFIDIDSPEYIDACLFKGKIYADLNVLDKAMEAFQKALEINPNSSMVFFNLGNLYFEKMKKYSEAEIQFRRAIDINPNYAEAHLNLGLLLNSQKKFSDAVIHLKKSFDIDSSQSLTFLSMAHAKMQMCEWSSYLKDISYIKDIILKKSNKSNPFILFHLFDEPEAQKKSAQTYSLPLKDYSYLNLSPPKKSQKKISVGYFSSDFHDHATAHLMTELLENHDKNKFKITAFSWGPITQDIWQKRIIDACDDFIDASSMNDEELIKIAQSKGLDIAIDLKGFTNEARFSVFSARLAKIHLSYLGYPGTSGSKYMDYLIADNFIIPKTSQKFYTEKIIYMPHCYQANMRDREISSKKFTRSMFNLPEDYFIFCSFNSNYKITPECFDAWMTILDNVKKSVLWIYISNDEAEYNLKKEALKRGVDPERLIFAKSMPIVEHFKRLGLADLFLDTFPCNAHTSASDALRMGLPIVTLSGKSFASRVCGSLLKTLGLKDLIHKSWEDYINGATMLARDEVALKKIRKKLKNATHNSALFNSELFTKDFESLLEDTLKLHKSGA